MATKRNDSEAGFTLVELLVGMAMSLIIAAAAVAMFTNTIHRQPEETATADVLGTARNAVEKITTDLREGEKATLSGPSSLMVKVPCTANAEGCEVSYRCAQEAGLATYYCTRTSEGSTTTIVKDLANGEVFCVFPTATAGKECGLEMTALTSPQVAEVEREPRYVGITLRYPNYKGTNGTTVLEDGAALHNRGLSGFIPPPQ
jgi:prepilin-type N-terminal cleavage/methylation domain-containing protein